jgi:hypothetical protein
MNMALTRDFKETVAARVQNDPAFVRISAIVTADSGIVTGGVCRGGLRGSQYRFLN